MKLLVGVGVACVLMLGVAVWQVWGSWSSHAATPGNVAADPRIGRGTRDGLQRPAAAPVATNAVPAAPEAGPASSDASVHWPEDPQQADVLRRLDAARAALRDDPDHERALHDELAALAELNRWPEAAQTLARLQRLRPDDLDVAFDYAAVLLRLHRSVEAVALLNEVVARQPEHARAWFNLAVAHQSLGHLEEARRAWNQAITLKPTLPAYAQRGTVLLDLHEWAAAAADFETVLKQQPDAADATLNLSLALWRSGRGEEARERLRTLLERHPDHIPALNRLAEMAWGAYQASPAGDAVLRDEAFDCWRRSLRADATQSEIQARLAEAQAPAP
jgi:tetratricopeptide (TPR) repeat protein